MVQLVFLTLYLGLVSGRQPIELKADPGVVAMRLELDDTVVATLNGPPWKTTVDFGQGLEPHELVAVGLDITGQEIGRASQVINIPRSVAEVEIVLQHDAGGTPIGAEVRWRHLTGEQPKSVTLTLDGRALPLRQERAALPPLDLATPHVLAAGAEFTLGIARNEIVFGGTLPESTGSQLTATAVIQTGSVPPSLDGCFAFNGCSIRAQAIEKNDALVILVLDPNPALATSRLIPVKSPFYHPVVADDLAVRRKAKLDDDTHLRLLWPVPDQVAAPDQPTSILFPVAGDFDMSQAGILWQLTATYKVKGSEKKRQFADAVAVAGLKAMMGARRRAVVLAIANAADASRYDGQTVRRYLASIGVPLFVWSLTGVHPELTAAWGDVVDVSSEKKLLAATELLRQNIATQRIVWLDADPIHALRATVKQSCGMAMVARHVEE